MLGATPTQSKDTPQNQVSTCAACGNENTADSRFCRHCGAALSANGDGVSSAVASATVAPPLEAAAPSSDGVAGLAAPAATLADSDGQSSHAVSDEIDHRRAQQLIDRAFMLAEKGDKPAAILACRQAVALDSGSVSAYSILGLLLEQTGDIPHAIQAYEKVLEISPDSLLEKESLQRLRASSSQQNTANMFHFDEKELYEDSDAADDAPATPSPAVAPVAAAGAGALAAGAAVAASASTPLPTNFAGATSSATTPAPRPSPSGLASLNQPATTGAAPVRPVDFGMSFDDKAGRGPLWWRALQRQPSYYFRGFPLAATTAMSLLFLLWARNWAVSQDQRSRAMTTSATAAQVADNTSGGTVAAPGVGGTAVNNPNGNSAAPNTSTGTAPGSPATNNGDSFSVSSGGTGTAAPGQGQATNNGASGTTSNPASAGGTSSANRPTGAGSSGGSRSVPKFPSVAPRQPAPANNGGDNGGADNPLNSLPPARIDPPVRGSDAVKVLPPDNSHELGSSSGGGAPINPAGSGRGYVRVSPYRVPPSAAPPRGETRANQAERDAAAHPDRAPEILTPSMDNGDVGWNYQSRALSFLERGDYARARDDFQTAINYYRDEIQRGVNVAAARKGMQACEDGRREALARLGR